jgi:hypothetical protein
MRTENGDGIETTLPVRSVHRVPEHKVTYRHLYALTERDESGEREGERVRVAERNLRIAIRRLLKWCPDPDFLHRVVASEVREADGGCR